jgi:hypothetical protein
MEEPIQPARHLRSALSSGFTSRTVIAAVLALVGVGLVLSALAPNDGRIDPEPDISGRRVAQLAQNRADKARSAAGLFLIGAVAAAAGWRARNAPRGVLWAAVGGVGAGGVSGWSAGLLVGVKTGMHGQLGWMLLPVGLATAALGTGIGLAIALAFARQPGLSRGLSAAASWMLLPVGWVAYSAVTWNSIAW